MNDKLKCFISASYNTDTSIITNLLAENNVEIFDLYDFSAGNSIQQILKRKLRQADFAIFIISEDNSNVIYEIGVCEGLGKKYFIILEKDIKIPFYLENIILIRSNLKDREFLKMSVHKILDSIKKKIPKQSKSYQSEKQIGIEYSNEIKVNLNSYLAQVKNLRKQGHGKELEKLIEEIFKTIQLNYVENSTNKEKGVDFALWSDELGKIIGNPIIVEVKYGNLNRPIIRDAEQQLHKFVNKTDAKVAILLYLDKNGKKYNIKSSLSPLIIGYDIEDFVNGLLNHSFEKLVLSQRNKIAHGIE